MRSPSQTNQPKETKTQETMPPQKATSPKRARVNLWSVGLILLSGAALWGVWRGTQSITPAAFQPVIAPAAPAKASGPVAKDPKGAAEAFAEARRQEGRIKGIWIPTRGMLENAQKAVALDATQPPYLVYLMQIYISLRKSEAAIATGRQLLALSPEHPWGNLMLANQMLENGAGEKEYPQIEAMLKFADKDPNLAPGLHYGRGLLALRRRQAPLAVSELKQACALDTNSSVGYYNLFLAEKMAGDKAGADWAMAQHNRCIQRNLAGLKAKDKE